MYYGSYRPTQSQTDEVESERWMLVAANGGYSKAMRAVGNLLYGRGGKANCDRAHSWFEKAIQSAHDPAQVHSDKMLIETMKHRPDCNR
jgi:TPR repeat protein